jgi:hypothetical protein
MLKNQPQKVSPTSQPPKKSIILQIWAYHWNLHAQISGGRTHHIWKIMTFPKSQQKSLKVKPSISHNEKSCVGF